jgi:hypothetical protein
MIILATTLLLAGSFTPPDPAQLGTNTMLRDAAVSHDLARVSRQFERALHGNPNLAAKRLHPPITR